MTAASTRGRRSVAGSTPAQIATVITDISHRAFLAGMHDAFLVAAGVALAGALIALITKRGNGAAAAHPAH
jgi:hypothetical protein